MERRKEVDVTDRMNHQALLTIAENEIGSARPEYMDLAALACSPAPSDAKFEMSFDEEMGYVCYVEIWSGGGRRELIVGSNGNAWDLTYEVKNSLTPTRITARKDLRGRITFENRKPFGH